MKATGIVRMIDSMGRFVIPAELRKNLGIDLNGGSFEVFINDDNSIVLKKYEPACIFCGNTDELVTFEDRKICRRCIDKMNSLPTDKPYVPKY